MSSVGKSARFRCRSDTRFNDQAPPEPPKPAPTSGRYDRHAHFSKPLPANRDLVARLEKAVGFGVSVFAIIRTNQHSDAWYHQFSEAVLSIPEIVEVYRASGDIDYIMRIVARDMDHYDRVYRQLIRKCEFSDVSSTFVMETIKESRELPI